MNSTKSHSRCRKLSWKGYVQKVSDVHREYARAHIDLRIDENNDIIGISWNSDESLLERVLAKQNINAAYLKVYKNKGAGGIDGMKVDDLCQYLREHQAELLEAIRIVDCKSRVF